MNKRFFPACILSACLIMQTVHAFAFYNPERQQILTTKEIVIEAENFTGEGFCVTEDQDASGGKCISGNGDRDAEMTYEFELDENSEDMMMFVTCKSPLNNQNLSYVSLDHYESYAVYNKAIGEWETVGLYYGKAYGRYKIKLRNIRAGQQIDKITVRYNIRKSKSENPIDGTEYMKGHSEYENLSQVPTVEERKGGSFFFEAENGLYGETDSETGYNEDCSGGAYWNFTSNLMVTDPNSYEAISDRFKYHVSTKGTYRLWVRCLAPNSWQKSTWVGMDDSDYKRIEKSGPTGWEWLDIGTYNLEKGWHTLNMKIRQYGHLIDCLMLTPVLDYTPVGKGSVPGEPVIPDSRGTAQYKLSREQSKIMVNNCRGRSDTEFIFQDNEIFVPVSCLSNMIGLSDMADDTSLTVKRDRNYIKFYKNSSKSVINGKTEKLKSATVVSKDGVLLAPISYIASVIGFDYDYDAKDNTVHVFDNSELSYREAEEDEIRMLPSVDDDANIMIPYGNPDAKVDVWVRLNETNAEALKRMNFDNMFDIAGGGYSMVWQGLINGFYWGNAGWIKTSTPYYKDGAFYTNRNDLLLGSYDVLAKINDNGFDKYMIAYDKFKITRNVFVNGDDVPSMAAFKYNTDGELLLVPTYENIGYYIDYKNGNVTECNVSYREKGSEEWKAALAPFHDKDVMQFRGSIVNLKENTAYEVKAEIKEGNQSYEKYSHITTWADNPPIGKKLKLSEIYHGKGALSLVDLSGNEDGWIYIDCEGDAIEAGTDVWEAVYISNCKYVILANAIITGGIKNCVNICNQSENIRLINCDISGWGPGDGVFDELWGMYFTNGYVNNYCSGIRLNKTVNCTIERCYIHDPKIKTNAWGETGRQVHPCGSSAILAGANRGTVIRYSDFVGSDKHRFNDLIEGVANTSYQNSALGHDSDVYGNECIYSQDDQIEVDGSGMNVRIYKNKMQQSLCGISCASMAAGPIYVFDNLITDMGTEINEQSGSAIKIGGFGHDKHIGFIYFINNTFDMDGYGIRQIGIIGSAGWSTHFHSFSRNNIIVSRTGKTVFENTYCDSLQGDDNNYDMLGGPIDFNTDKNQEKNSVSALPKYVDKESGNYNLAAFSDGVDKGVVVPNFKTEYVGSAPDMGAFECGGEQKALPYRPVDMYAEKTFITLNKNDPAEITVNVGDVDEQLTYSIVKNKDFDWLSIELDKTEKLPVKANTQIKFKISADMSKSEYNVGNGLILIRLSNGYSVPIRIKAVR